MHTLKSWIYLHSFLFYLSILMEFENSPSLPLFREERILRAEIFHCLILFPWKTLFFILDHFKNIQALRFLVYAIQKIELHWNINMFAPKFLKRKSEHQEYTLFIYKNHEKSLPTSNGFLSVFHNADSLRIEAVLLLLDSLLMKFLFF